MKHLALDFHFVREKVQQGTLRVQHIVGDDQLADALTKPLLTMFSIFAFEDWPHLRIVLCPSCGGILRYNPPI